MDEVIAKFKTPESCEQFAINVEGKQPERALEARRRAVELRAQQYGANTAVELDSLAAIYAYEWTLFKKHGRHQRAAYTWRKVRNDGIVGAVQDIVLSDKETVGFRALAQEGMLDMAFEAVVIRHPEAFLPAAVRKAQSRLAAWEEEEKQTTPKLVDVQQALAKEGSEQPHKIC